MLEQHEEALEVDGPVEDKDIHPMLAHECSGLGSVHRVAVESPAPTINQHFDGAGGVRDHVATHIGDAHSRGGATRLAPNAGPQAKLALPLRHLVPMHVILHLIQLLQALLDRGENAILQELVLTIRLLERDGVEIDKLLGNRKGTCSLCKSMT